MACGSKALCVQLSAACAATIGPCPLAPRGRARRRPPLAGARTEGPRQSLRIIAGDDPLATGWTSDARYRRPAAPVGRLIRRREPLANALTTYEINDRSWSLAGGNDNGTPGEAKHGHVSDDGVGDPVGRSGRGATEEAPHASSG